MKKKIRIALDGRYLHGEKRGLNQYSLNLLYQIESLSENLEAIVFTNGKKYEEAISHFKHVKIIPTIPSIYPIWEKIVFPIYSIFYKANYIHFTANTGGWLIAKFFKKKIIVTIHDVYFMNKGKNFPQGSNIRQKIGSFYRRIVVPNIALKSDKIITVSNFAKEELIKKLKIDRKKICVINNVIDEIYLNFLNEKNFKKKENILVIIGGDHPQKNIINTIYLLEKNCSDILKNWKVIICGLEKLRNQIKCDNLNLTLLSHISEITIFELLKKSKILLFPSLHESFGIPILEALATKNSIIAMNAGASNEILNGYGQLYNFNDGYDLRNKLDLTINSNVKINNEREIEEYLLSFSNSEMKSSLLGVYKN